MRMRGLTWGISEVLALSLKKEVKERTQLTFLVIINK